MIKDILIGLIQRLNACRITLFVTNVQLISQMSAEETREFVIFIRRSFNADKWAEKTTTLSRYMYEIESQMTSHWIKNGPDAVFRFTCRNDDDEHCREGYKMGEFLNKFYSKRGYNIYSKAEEIKSLGMVWELNFSLSGIWPIFCRW